MPSLDPRTLNVIGCGKVGKALARLWTRQGLFQVVSILNRSHQSAKQAAQFVGAGRAITHADALGRADVVMIAASDEAIETCCQMLAQSGTLDEAVVVFHCSGSLPSTVLEAARARSAAIAGMHPVKSFADPAAAADTFSGTFCAIEGDPAACDLLGEVVHRCGGTAFHVRPEFKTIYHAATVLVCNDLVALVEAGLRCFEKAGIDRPTATRIAEPIVRGTVDQLFKLGPVEGLTGPVARGEMSVVRRQLEALAGWDATVERIYRALAQLAVDLSAAQGHAPVEALEAIRKLLHEEPSRRPSD